MGVAAEKLSILKASLLRRELGRRDNHDRVALGHPETDSSLKGGIGRGAVHEIFPAAIGDETAASGFATALAACVAAKKRMLWIVHDFAALENGEISALGLREMGLEPLRFLLLRAPDCLSVLRAATDALACRALGAVIMEISGVVKALDLAASRRLVLAAAESGVTTFLVRCSAEPKPSAAETRWLVRAARSERSNENWGHPLFDVELARNRHGPTGQWLMEWNSDDGLFRAADSGAVVSAPSDRPFATAAAHDETLSRVA